MTDPPSAARAAAPLTPVASYPGADDATGARVVALLAARAIEAVACGSIGYTVSVDATQADEARGVLEAAVASEGLKVTVLRDTPPAR